MFLTNVKDLDLKILGYLDDRSLIEACKTNQQAKIICDTSPEFWHQRYIANYGARAASFKNKDRSWKDYYLLTLHYDSKYFPNKVLEKATEKGHVDIIKLFLDNKAKLQGSRAIKIAAKNNNIEILNLLMPEKYVDLQNDALEGAAEGGHEELIEKLINDGAGRSFRYMTRALTGAIKGRHLELVNKFGKVSDWNEALVAAAFVGDMDLINMALRHAADNLPAALNGAAEGGHMNLVTYFIDFINSSVQYTQIGNAIKNALMYAALGGHKEIVDYLLNMTSEEKGLMVPVDYHYNYNLNSALSNAALGGHKELFDYLISKGATNFKSSFFNAVLSGYRELAEYIAALGGIDQKDMPAILGHIPMSPKIRLNV